MGRLALFVLVGALVMSYMWPALARRLPPPPATDAAFLTVAAPQHVEAGAVVAVLVGLELPDGATRYRLRACREMCWTVRRGESSGPGAWWGRVAQLELDPGRYRLTLDLLRPWGSWGDRVVASHTWEVEVD